MGRTGFSLVLSGGGVRAVAQIGAIRALEENKLRPARIAGASSGALVGALFAAGKTPDEMLELFREEQPFEIGNLSLLNVGLIDSAKLESKWSPHFEGQTFDELDIPLAVTATDLVTAECVVLERGPVTAAVIASAAFPMLFTPHEINGRLLIDGGVMNNFPAELVGDDGRPAVGIYVNPVPRLGENEGVSNLVAMGVRALELTFHSRFLSKRDLVNVLIAPEAVGEFPTFGASDLEAIHDIGYRAALERCEEIAQLVRG